VIDVEILRGSSIRSGERQGRIERVSMPWVRFEWDDEDALRSEAVLRSDQRVEAIEVLTLDRGWVPLKSILGAVKENREMTTKSDKIKNLVEEVRSILSLKAEEETEEAEEALHQEAVDEIVGEIFGEAKDDGGDVKGKFKKKTLHNPFRRSPKLGPTKIPGVSGRVLRKKGYWSCRCSNYRCMCKGSEGERKKVVIGRQYKKVYNTKYRKWRAGATKFKKGIWKKKTASK
jgi:hypothetical protein